MSIHRMRLSMGYLSARFIQWSGFGFFQHLHHFIFPPCHENLRDMFAQWILHSPRSTCSRQGHSNLGLSLCWDLESMLSLMGEIHCKPCMFGKTWSIVVSLKLVHHPILGLNAKPWKCQTLMQPFMRHQAAQITSLFVVVMHGSFSPYSRKYELPPTADTRKPVSLVIVDCPYLFSSLRFWQNLPSGNLT